MQGPSERGLFPFTAWGLTAQQVSQSKTQPEEQILFIAVQPGHTVELPVTDVEFSLPDQERHGEFDSPRSEKEFPGDPARAEIVSQVEEGVFVVGDPADHRPAMDQAEDPSLVGNHVGSPRVGIREGGVQDPLLPEGAALLIEIHPVDRQRRETVDHVEIVGRTGPHEGHPVLFAGLSSRRRDRREPGELPGFRVEARDEDRACGGGDAAAQGSDHEVVLKVGEDPQILQPALGETLLPEFRILDPVDHHGIIAGSEPHVVVDRVPSVTGEEAEAVGPVLLLVVHRPDDSPDLPTVREKGGIAAVVGEMQVDLSRGKSPSGNDWRAPYPQKLPA